MSFFFRFRIGRWIFNKVFPLKLREFLLCRGIEAKHDLTMQTPDFSEMSALHEKIVGLDKSNGKGEGAITEGYWLNGVFIVTKVHRLTKRATDRAICFHDFAVTDGAFDYCIRCGEKRPLH